jgi:hypothetical protein
MKIFRRVGGSDPSEDVGHFLNVFFHSFSLLFHKNINRLPQQFCDSDTLT